MNFKTTHTCAYRCARFTAKTATVNRATEKKATEKCQRKIGLLENWATGKFRNKNERVKKDNKIMSEITATEITWDVYVVRGSYLRRICDHSLSLGMTVVVECVAKLNV